MLNNGKVLQRGQKRLPPSMQMNILYAEIESILKLLKNTLPKYHSRLKFYIDNTEIAKLSCCT